MPIVQATVIEGYDDATKARLLQGMTRVVLSVMAARPEAVVALLNEVKPSAYARGGVSRIPGPPLPSAIEVVREYVLALGAGGEQSARALLADGACFIDRTGAVGDPLSLLASLGGLDYTDFDEALTDDGSVVYARGTRGSVERFHIRGGRIVSIQSWGGRP